MDMPSLTTDRLIIRPFRTSYLDVAQLRLEPIDQASA